MKFFIQILILLIAQPVLGQDLLWTQRKTINSDDLKKIYEHYTNSNFSDIAHELARRAAENSVLEGYIPEKFLKSPWNYSLGLTLSSAWSYHTDYAERKETRGKKFDILMSVIEDKSVGDGGRALAIHNIANRLSWGSNPVTDDKSLPPMDVTEQRLRIILLDERESDFLRRTILPILYEYGNPNDYLDLAIELSSRVKNLGDRSEAFRLATPIRNSAKLTAEDLSKYLIYAFKLLESIDDKSGSGYFLAMHIGGVVGVKPVRDGQGSFAPDQRLAEYQGKNGLNDLFFQKTVDNAMNWWTINKHKYINE